jgi:hypothetical protein
MKVNPPGRKPRNPNITILQCNVRGARTNTRELQSAINHHSVDIALLNETKLKPDSLFEIPGFIIHRLDCRQGNHGGSLIAVRDTIKHELLESDRFEDTLTFAELVQISVSLDPQTNLKISTIYNNPTSALPRSFLEKALLGNKYCYMAGDLNAKHPSLQSSHVNKSGEILLDFLQEENVVLLNDGEHTHYSDAYNSSSMLDLHIATSHAALKTGHVLVGEDIGSDHLPTITKLCLKNTEISLPPSNQTLFDYNRANWQEYSTEIQKTLNSLDDEGLFPEQEMKTTDEIDKAIELLAATIQEAQDATIPKLDLNRRLLPRNVLDIIRKRRKCRRLLARINKLRLTRELTVLEREEGDTLRRTINELRDKTRVLINNIKTERAEKIAESLHEQQDMRIFWRDSKKLMGTDPSSERPYTLELNGRKAITDPDKANMFAEYLQYAMTVPESELFEESFRKHVDDTIQAAQEDLKPKWTTDDEIAEMSDEQKKLMREISEDELTRVLKGTKNTAPGEDSIKRIHLTHIPPICSLLLLAIFNSCLRMGYFPDSWKISNDKMIHKPFKNWKLPKNFRPIALTSVIGKTLERIIAGRLTPSIEEDNLYGPFQAAYRKGFSATDHILRLAQWVMEAFLWKEHVCCIFLDVDKAFDKVWHNGLKYQLLNTNFPKPYTRLLANYLDNRQIRVRQGHSSSPFFSPTAGIPQGGVLAPLLFAMYMKPISAITTAGLIISQYADDIALWFRSSSKQQAVTKVQEGLNQLATICAKWRISLNPTKTDVILFSRTDNKSKPRNLQLQNQELAFSKTARFLGVHFDQKMSWRPHIDQLQKRIWIRITELKKLAGCTYLTSKQLTTIYRTYIRPVMLFGGAAILNASPTLLQKIQVLQNTAIKTALKLPRYASTATIHSETKLPLLADHLLAESKRLAKNSIQKKNPLIADLFKNERRPQGTKNKPKTPVAFLREPLNPPQ